MGSHTPDASWSSGGGSFDLDFDFTGLQTLDEATTTITTKTVFYPDLPPYVPEKGDRDVHPGGYGGSFLDNTAPLFPLLATGKVSSVYGGRAGYPDPHGKNSSGKPNPTSLVGLVGLHEKTRIKYETLDNVLGGAGGGGGGKGSEAGGGIPQGGTGGGGNGHKTTTQAVAGTANTGGGGGGTGASPSHGAPTYMGKAGGSGVVIIRYKYQG